MLSSEREREHVTFFTASEPSPPERRAARSYFAPCSCPSCPCEIRTVYDVCDACHRGIHDGEDVPLGDSE